VTERGAGWEREEKKGKAKEGRKGKGKGRGPPYVSLNIY